MLPTGRSSRFSSGLRIEDFPSHQYHTIYLASKGTRSALLFSDMEKLDGHGNSILLRLKKVKSDG